MKLHEIKKMIETHTEFINKAKANLRAVKNIQKKYADYCTENSLEYDPENLPLKDQLGMLEVEISINKESIHKLNKAIKFYKKAEELIA